jgi:hypothetical protein
MNGHDPDPITVGPYQIRHTELGVLQGLLGGYWYWFPHSATPALGIVCLHDLKVAEDIVRNLQESPDMRAVGGELVIERWDKELHQRLRIQAMTGWVEGHA